MFCGSQREADVDSLIVLIEIYEDRHLILKRRNQMGDDLHLRIQDALQGQFVLGFFW